MFRRVIVEESVLPVRTIMLGVFGFVIAAILSVVVVQRLEGKSGDQSITPPDPLVVAPEKAAEQNP
ncbi:hypothetical protein C8J34_102377 [Rhizobium sp. PP-F2F-G36]|nr:hypothetical protein C8J34_102377 [Rhizobium sp. PP-F2F-G36]